MRIPKLPKAVKTPTGPRQPAGAPRYRRQVALLATLGLGVVWSVAAVSVVLGIAGFVVLADVLTELVLVEPDEALLRTSLGAGLLLLSWSVGFALYTRPQAVSGHTLKREHAAALFDEIEQLRSRIGAPRIHEVRLGDEFNAAIVRSPRLGALGWHHNTLVIGLPLLLALDGASARAVLAHELAHLAVARGGFEGRAYRLRHRWRHIADALRGSTFPTRFLLGRFFRWYTVRYSRLTLTLAREHEYFADAVAADTTSVVDTAGALVWSYAYSRCVQFDYWAPVFGRLGQQEYPPQRAWSNLARFVGKASEDRQKMLSLARWVLDDTTRLTDAHPALSDRLAVLDAPEVLPRPLRHSAASSWLGRHEAYLLQRFDTHWWLEQERRWRHSYGRTRSAGQPKSREREQDTPA